MNNLVSLSIPMPPPDAELEARAALQQSQDIEITTALTYQDAAQFLMNIKAAQKRIDMKRKEILTPLDDSRKRIQAFFRKPLECLSQAEIFLKNKMIAFQRAEEEKRLAAQRAAEELARKERERLERLAEAARKRDDVAKVEQFEQRAATVVAPIIQAEKPRVAGIATRKRYTFQIVDAAQLPRDYLQPDTVKIGKVVRALGADANIPGIRIIEEETIASRAFA